ncbi:hypothetical protein ACTUSN_03620 [Pantoea ananatis]|uniref:hypothetical protein n=1 Tax=Pantoea ananas TaxID=553 RepID=UPI003FA44CC2
MTTNSPNPVDGDVQALIADCQAEIAELEKSLTTWGDAWIPSLQSKLKRQKVALAALTAVPRRMRQANGENSRTWVECGGDYHRGTDFYTTPPAQLLRQVELPESQRLCNGYYFDMNDVFEALEEAGIPFKVKS